MGGSSTLQALLGTALRGLRSRLLLTAGSMLLAAISVGAAVVGPMYQAGAASSYLVTKLRAEPNFATGFVFDYYPPETGSVFYGPGHFAAGGYARAMTDARRLADAQLNDMFRPATAMLRTARAYSSRFQGEAMMLASRGACAHLVVEGRCPEAPGEVLVLRQDSRYADVRIGERFRLPSVSVPLEVVGLYSPRAEDDTYWFDLADLASLPPSPPQPYRPAPLITALGTFDSVSLPPAYVTATRRLLVTPSTSVDDLDRAVRAAAGLKAGVEVPSRVVDGVTPEVGNQLPAIAREVTQRASTARSTVAPAVVSVVLVALVLLVRLLSAAMDLRRSELALASLRGYSRRQMWVLGLLEPVLTLGLATPLGLVGGLVCYLGLSRTWLVPGLPVPTSAGSLVAVLTVLVAGLAVAALVVRGSLAETLAQQIAGVRRPGRSGRWVLLARLVVVAAAVAVLVATLSAGKRSSPNATDLALPILLAAAAGLLTTVIAQALARSWSSWTAARSGVFSFLAARTISRRHEGTLVILPLTAALAVSIFATGVYAAAADWRGSDAATVVGADRSYPTKVNLGQAVALTHQIDPAGRWLMAAGANYDGENQLMILDTPRLSRVGLWPASWTPGMSSAQIQEQLAPQRPSVVLRGSRLSLTLDNQVTGDYATLAVQLSMTDDDGQPSTVIVGAFPRGVRTVTARITGCRSGCLLTELSFGGPAGITEAMSGTATITDVSMDGRPVAAFLDLPWRVAVPFLGTPSGVAGPPRTSGGRLTVAFDAADAESFAAITPADVPLARPVLTGRTAPIAAAGEVGAVTPLNRGVGVTIPVRPIARAESMPVLGPVGVLVDYTMLTRDVMLNDPNTVVAILARGDTPPSVAAALADRGISDPVTIETTRALLDNDAFALALNLYLVVTVIVIVLALAGLGASLTVQLPARRRDAASLRVVGLRRRSILTAVITEFVVVLGAAAVAGVGAGSLAQYVVVRTVTLGYADSSRAPRLLPTLDLPTVLSLLLVVTAMLGAVAVLVAGLTVRGARTASLRETAR